MTKTIIFFATSLLCISAIFAQTDTTKTVSLENVGISASSNSNQELLEKSIPFSKLAPLELNRGTGISLDDAI